MLQQTNLIQFKKYNVKCAAPKKINVCSKNLVLGGKIFVYKNTKKIKCYSTISSRESTAPKILNFYIIDNPFDNRKLIAEYAKNKKGVYKFEILNLNKNLYYIGSSINLYSRVCSYFMPSILSKADRRVLRYFNKYGFKDVKLSLYVLEDNASIVDVLNLEKYYIDSYPKENLLNIENIPGSGFHLPMSEVARNKLRKFRGQVFYVYDTKTKTLIFIFDSKQFAYDNVNIDHRTLNNCLYEGNLYLNRFMFSLEPIKDFVYEAFISLKELKTLIKEQRYTQKNIQSTSKKIFVVNISNPSLNREFDSISQFAFYVKGDRGTIRSYIDQTKLYRGKWKITLIK
uniref:GIY-YIG homing endonuclease n=1 Tax=Tricholoma bakamatsutake TaxID=51221 RepID=A0A6C0W4I6_9AGAR|nr:GIY-YIG homing endonuclease [Tricholoma bakamatsutake]QIC20173.1 GIY-YIG homing endonuclease [Tricholoma bakamatsutake]